MMSTDERNKFEYIYNKYKNLLLYKAYEILKDLSLAEDSANEAFIRIFQNIHKIEDPDSDKSVSFLVTIVRNTSLTILKKEKRNYTDEIPLDLEDNFDLEREILSDMISIDIYKALDNLDEESKSIFLLRFAHDFSHKEIESILNINENNIRIKLHRAKKKLAKLIGREVYYE